MIAKITDFACELKEKHGACALKLGTEQEANSFEEIDELNRLLGSILPIIVKIGGCDARNDIKTLSRMGILGLIAPMIESGYGLFNFVRALSQELGSDFKRHYPFLAINIESRTGYSNLDEIISSENIRHLDQITIGRTDMSSSYGVPVDDPELERRVIDITRKAQESGLTVSVGGQITPGSSVRIRDFIKPEKVNIRTVVISLAECPDIAKAIKKALEFEILLLKYLMNKSSSSVEKLENRICVIQNRLQN